MNTFKKIKDSLFPTLDISIERKRSDKKIVGIYRNASSDIIIKDYRKVSFNWVCNKIHVFTKEKNYSIQLLKNDSIIIFE